MTSQLVLQIAVILIVVSLCAIPTGAYLAQVGFKEPTWLDPVFDPIDHLLLALIGPAARRPMGWKRYTLAMLTTNLAMGLAIFAILLYQGHLPWNPQGFGGLEPTLAFNTAISFVTNTDWQAYTGEATLSNFSQMAAITFPMFTSATTGLVLFVAFTRGLVGQPDMGNFFEDLVRFLTRVLLPVALLGALFLIWQGVPQTLDANPVTVHGISAATQSIPVGPVASLESIKHFGTNGGGFYGQNSTHPFENPTPVTNVAETFMMMLFPMSLVFAFGHMIRNHRQARVIFWSMAGLFVIFLGVALWAETAGNPIFTHLGLDQAATALQAGGNMEGKEVRFGQGLTSLFVTATTAMTTGTIDCMHDSLTPMGGFVTFALMMLNCVFGGKGVGLINYLMYGILAVFLTGLMVGRTPEFLGKKIEKPEVVLASIAILIHPLIILAPTAMALVVPQGLSGISNPGLHGLSEVLYGYTSAAANNGSAFAGLAANTAYYNTTLGVVIGLGRYLSLIAMMAIAGSLSAKKAVPESVGTLRTDTWLFGGIWVGTLLIVGALTFFPVLALGPIAEHVAMLQGKVF